MSRLKESALVLLPGLLCDGTLWQDVVARLDRRLGIAVMDLTQQSTIEAMAASVLARAPPRFSLAGFSMGGQVALEIAARAPERVTRLALMSTNAHGLTPVVQAHIAHAIERVATEGLAGYLSDAFPLYFAGRSDTVNPLRDVYFGMGNQLGPEVAVRQMRALLSFAGTTLDLATIDCPTSVICGALDARTPPALHADMAARIPGATLRIIQGSGHFTLLEKPADVARAMEGWLAS